LEGSADSVAASTLLVMPDLHEITPVQSSVIASVITMIVMATVMTVLIVTAVVVEIVLKW